MDDLISRAYVLAEYDRQHKGPPGGARKIMENAPAVEAVPVVHAMWVEETDHSYHWHCSKCKQVWGMTKYFMKYCPNCGAKMDGERKNEQDG